VFWPDGARGNLGKVPATGGVYGAGNYALYTGMEKGVPPGWYKVLVFPMALSSSDPVPKRFAGDLPESAVDARYMDLDTTPLSLEVTRNPAEEAYHLRLAR